MATFEEMVAKERERLQAALAGVAAKIAALNAEALGYKREMAAVDAYDAAKAGKSVRSTSTSARGSRGSKQETLLSLIGGSKSGMTRGEILENLGLKGDKKGEQSISNALNNMKKAGKVTAANGRYEVA